MKKMLLILAVYTSAFSWDGERQGFILGVGAGSSDNIVLNGEASNDGDWVTRSSISLSMTSRIGYAYTNHNAILIYGNRWPVSYTHLTLPTTD